LSTTENLQIGLVAFDRVALKARNLRGVFNMATKAFKANEAAIWSLKRELQALEHKLRDLHQRPFVRNIETEKEPESSDLCDRKDQQREPKKRGAARGCRGAAQKVGVQTGPKRSESLWMF